MVIRPGGFVTCTRFWELVPGPFVPIKASGENAREARLYENGNVLVRYEIPDAEVGKSPGNSHQLLKLFDPNLRLLNFTVVYGRGAKTVINLNRELLELQKIATATGDAMLLRTLDAIGFGQGESEPHSLIVDGSPGRDVFWQLYGCTDEYFVIDPKSLSADRCRGLLMLLAYIAFWAPPGNARGLTATCNLGEVFFYGDYVGKDEFLGEYWLRSAAEAGDDYAKRWMAVMRKSRS